MSGLLLFSLFPPRYMALHGVGKRLVQQVKERYADYLRIVVIAYDDEAGFYENCGFKKAKDASPLFITKLWT